MCGCLSRAPLGTWPATQACALIGNRASTSKTFGLQAGTQSTEPHQPGQDKEEIIK